MDVGAPSVESASSGCMGQTVRIEWAHELLGFMSMRGGKAVDEKSPVNLRVRSSLKAKAKSLGLNLSRTLEVALEREISRREQEAWISENRMAIEAYNRRIEEHGPALSAYRSF